MALQAGRLFGNYRVVRLIGEGAFGEVYLAENPLIERRAAIKVLRPLLALDTELVRRFFNEARAASAIRHPNIIDVYDAGETPEGAPYILMEFLEGTSLKKRLAEVGRLSVAQAMEIAVQASSALAAAHAVGIVHRDLKPENLFLVPDVNAPGGERVKILDFGIAKVKCGGGAGGTFRTEAGLIMGSPTYMSPEQCMDSADVDLRADIYSFATILYEMLAGRPPYVAAAGMELLLMHLTETPRPLRELAPHVPGNVEDAVMRALHHERSERFEEVPSFLKALTGGAITGPTETLPGEYALPARAASLAHADRKVAALANSTFSQANAQVVTGTRLQPRAGSRWIGRGSGLAFGGLVVLGFGFLWLFQRDRERSPGVVQGAVATPPGAVVRVWQPRLESAPPAVFSNGAADGGVRPSALVVAPPTEDAPVAATNTKEHPTTAPARPTVVKHAAAALKRRLARAQPPAQNDQEDVAGF